MYSQKNNNHQPSYHLPKLHLPTIKSIGTCQSDRSINKNQSKLYQMLSQLKLDEDDKKRVNSILKNKEKIVEIVPFPQENSCEPRRITLSRPTPQKLNLLSSKKQCKSEEQYESETELDFEEMDDYDQFSIFSQKKKIHAIRTKLKESANDSYFGFIKQSEKMKDLYLNYKDEQDIIQDDIYYYCLNDDIFPKKFELLLTDETFDLSDQGVTAKYIPIIVNYLKQKTIKQLNISGNRINEWTLRQLIDQFPKNLKTLDLSNNELGRPGGLVISNHILKLKFLKNLNLSCNQLGDAGVQGLLTNLIKHTTIKKVNLSENNLTDSLQLTLFSFISTNSTVENIVLCWNKLGVQSWNLIIKALQLNRKLKILDLSYNKINSNENDEAQLTNYYNTFCNLNLVHLDISFNQFGLKFMQMLRQALSKNEILYGLHVQGNKCSAYIDELGFIQIEQEDKQIYSIHPTHHKIDGVKFLPLGNEDLSGNDNCWICQGWMEYQFVYLPKKEFGELYIHFDFLNYRPIQMITSIDLLNLLKQRNISKNIILELTSGEIMHQLKEIVTTEKNITLSAINEAFESKSKPSNLFLEELLDDLEKFYYICFMMLPPNRKVHYFYSSSNSNETFYNQNLPTIQRPINDLYIENYVVVKEQQIKISNQVNFIQTKQMFVIDPKNNYKPFVKVLPRCTNKYRIDLNRFQQGSNHKRINYIHWKREDSLFSQYRQEDENLVEQCFNFDWECCSIKDYFNQEYDLNQLKKSIRQFYPLIKDFYKFHSSEGYKPPHLIMFCVTFMRFQQIILQFSKMCDCQIISEQIKKLKIESEHKYIYNPSQGIIRYQFLELLFRIAILQQTNKRVFADAVNSFFKQFKDKLLNFDKISEWRVQRLWTKECSLQIQVKHNFLCQLFEKIASIRNEKWSFKLKWVSLYDLIEFCYTIGLSEFISEAEIKIIFNYSMQTEVDEVSIDKTIRMGYLEFIEALGRLAEIISFAPVGQNILEWTQDDRQILPLHVKFESFLTYIMFHYKKEYEKYIDLFDLSQIPQLPTRIHKYNDKYEDQNLILTVYNTLHYLNLHSQPYLNPNYKEYLAQNINLNTQKSRSPGRVLKSQKTIKNAYPKHTSRKNMINY